MYTGRIVFSQLVDLLSRREFDKCVRWYRGNHRIRTFSCFNQFLCMAFAQHPCQEQPRLQPTLVSSDRQVDWPAKPPDNHSQRPENFADVSRSPSTRQLPRRRDRRPVGVPDEQFRASTIDHCTVPQKPRASGAFLQMDQTASTHQDVLWHVRERGEDPGLGRHRQKHHSDSTAVSTKSCKFSALRSLGNSISPRRLQSLSRKTKKESPITSCYYATFNGTVVRYNI